MTNLIPVYAATCIDHIDGERRFTEYQYTDDTPESTYSYGIDGERIGAQIERGPATLVGHIQADPGVTLEIAFSKCGETILFVENSVTGYPASDVVTGGIKGIRFIPAKGV